MLRLPAASKLPVVCVLVISVSAELPEEDPVEGSGTRALWVPAGRSVRESTIGADVVSLVSLVTGILAWWVGVAVLLSVIEFGSKSLTDPGSFCTAC